MMSGTMMAPGVHISTKPNVKCAMSKVWWRGARGEWYVLAQALLFLLVAFGPRSWPGLPAFAPLPRALTTVLAVALLVTGFVLGISGGAWLRSNLSPFPYPRENATLVRTGPFRFVRHPMYSGAIMIALGWSFEVQGLLTLLYSILLFVLLDLKSRREEGWLNQRFPAYGEYQNRTRKLVPFIY
jgi:protein-S-isoprenylcysteine O-methyltransferase Ste14